MGEHVRRRRQELGLTQREAAKTLAVSLATLRNWEAGRAKVGEAYYRKVIGHGRVRQVFKEFVAKGEARLG